VARSRAKLLAAATELLVESGPRAVTVDAVAEGSGVAKSTLYRHWASQTELLVDVIRHNVPTLSRPDLDGGFEAALRSVLREVAATLADPDWARILPALISLGHQMPELAALVDSDADTKAEVVASVLELGIAEGRPLRDLDVHRAACLLFGPLVFAAINGETDLIGDLADDVVQRFLASCPPAPAGG
jgi:AcrR family transcriptional regulator